MARMHGTEWLGEQSPKRPMTRYDAVCVHTIVGYAPAHAAHFSVKADGTIQQSRDTVYQSGANLNGNHRVIAIENEDHGPAFPKWSGSNVPPLTAAQVEANARILAWAHETHGIPLQLCPDSRPHSRGLAYHRQGIDGNFGDYDYPGRVQGGEVWTESFGKVCPGDRRIAQLPEILARAIELASPKPEHLPLRVWFANLDWSTGRGKDREHLAHLCEKADVLLLVEAKNVDVQRLLPVGWTANQDTSEQGRAGSVVAWRTDLFANRRRILRQIAPRIWAVAGDAGMLTRFANVQTLKVKTTGETYRFVAAHYAPARYIRTWPLTTRTLKRIRRRPLLPPVVIGVDANQHVDELASDLRLVDYSRGIVGVMVAAKRVRVTEGPLIDRFGKSNQFTDHPDIGVVLERK